MANKEENGGSGGFSDRPAPLVIVAGEDNHDRWKIFKEAWENYSLLNNIYSREPAMQVESFRIALGEPNRVLLQNLGLGALEKNDAACQRATLPCKSLTKIITALDYRFFRHQNSMHRRFIFRKAMQNTGETVPDFFDRVVRLAKTCNFPTDSAENEIRDQLILGTNLTEARASTFRGARELSLEEALRTLRLYEENEKAPREIGNASTQEHLNVVKARSKTAQQRRTSRSVDSVVGSTRQGDAQHMVKHARNAEKETTLKTYAAQQRKHTRSKKRP